MEISTESWPLGESWNGAAGLDGLNEGAVLRFGEFEEVEGLAVLSYFQGHAVFGGTRRFESSLD